MGLIILLPGVLLALIFLGVFFIGGIILCVKAEHPLFKVLGGLSALFSLAIPAVLAIAITWLVIADSPSQRMPSQGVKVEAPIEIETPFDPGRIPSQDIVNEVKDDLEDGELKDSELKDSELKDSGEPIAPSEIKE